MFKYILATTTMLCATLVIDAQNKISGHVTDINGTPLAGANVYWANTYDGVSTQTDGSFSISTKDGNTLLVASFMGYISDTLTVSNTLNINNITFKLNDENEEINEVVVSSRKRGTTRLQGVTNSIEINQAELFKAACCNLGESFSTNPSVDVNYTDAATGAKQIKLLGLSGIYVQMLAENIPDFRLAATPYALGYVPGAWLKGIQVSKGASSVKNGYESITGQIDIEYLKPDEQQGAGLNIYGNTDGRIDLNADANKHFGDVSTILLAHYENSFADVDDNNDNFLDKPNVQQFNLHNRWHFAKHHYIFHGGVSVLTEDRKSGQIEQQPGVDLFKIDTRTHRYGAYLKNAWIVSHEKNASIALITNFTLHDFDSDFGKKSYSTNEKNLYAQLIYDTEIVHHHSISTGISGNYDYDNQDFSLTHTSGISSLKETEKVGGIYAQYTYDHDGKVVLMAGVRADHSSEHGTFWTPRFHAKLHPNDYLTVRLSTGKGYRTPRVLAENHYLLSSGRLIEIGDIEQESAWNSGATISASIPTGDKMLKISTEYFYTSFESGLTIDYDIAPNKIAIYSSDQRSYSQTFQTDATYEVLKGLELQAAYRLTDVRAHYNNKLQTKPLTNKYKALFTLSYKTPLAIWQFDANLQINGGGRLPAYYNADMQKVEGSNFSAYEQLNVQITKWFKHFSVYIGGENLTNYKQTNQIISAENPWADSFEPTLVYAPISGTMFYAGLRFNFMRDN